MDVKYMLMLSVLLSVATDCFCITLNFCSGDAIREYFDASSKESALKLDGSNSAISLSAIRDEQISCTCIVTPSSVATPGKLEVAFEYLTDVKNCNKRIDVVAHGGDVVHLFECVSDYTIVKAKSTEEEVQFTLNIFENPVSTNNKVADDMYHLYVKPDPGSVLTVRCNDAVPLSNSSSSSSSTSSSSTVASTITTGRLAKSGSFDTSIVIGIVVGVGLFFLIFISCTLLYIARRKERRDNNEKPNATSQQPQQRYVVTRTLSTFYNKIKPNRPLPRVPASIRNITRWRTRPNGESGVYDSIKSDYNKGKFQLDKQGSQDSHGYMEPATITTLSEATASHGVNGINERLNEIPKNRKPVNMHAKTGDLEKRNLATVHREHEEPMNDSYIHPVSGTGKDKEDKVDPHDASENGHSSHVYVNASVTKSPQGGSNRKATEAEREDSGYIDMSNVSDKQNIADKNMADSNNSCKKVPSCVDTDYVPMDASNVSQAKELLEPKDSTFPELIEFTPHGRDSKDSGVGDLDLNIIKDNTENQNNERKNIRTKKYVKDKNSKIVD